jgi:two-component system, LuxR family, response regulator FixJ
MQPPLSVYIISSERASVLALELLLHSAGFMSASYDDPRAFVMDASRLDDGCVLLHAVMPTMTGIEVSQLQGFSHPVIVIAEPGHVKTAVTAMKAGAVDVFEKPINEQALLGCIRSCFANKDTAKRNAERARSIELISALTRREAQVLHGLVHGSSNKTIAFELGISVRTVEIHRARMMQRLGTKQLADVVRIAVTAKTRRARPV